MSGTTLKGSPWRRRVLASTGVAAMAVAGGVSLAGTANAAPPAPTAPSLTLAGPSQIYNAGDNTPWQPLDFTVDNTAVGALKANVALTISLSGLPSNVDCGNVVLSGSPALSAQGGSDGNCSWTVTRQVQSGDTWAGEYQVKIDTTSGANLNGQTGTLTWQASGSVTYPSYGGNPDKVNSNTVTSSLVGPSAPEKVGDAPAAAIYRAYDHQVIKPGVPHADRSHIKVTNVSDGNSRVYPSTCRPGQLGAGYKYCYKLNNGLEYNALTGHITRPTQVFGSAQGQLNRHPDTYRINVDNTNQGPSTSNDLGSATVTVVIPNLFQDVSTTHPFANEIYDLVGLGVVNGYADGTFRPTVATSRQAFAHYIWTAYGKKDGSCSTNKGSAFSDVPNSSQFCKSIRGLSQRGVINGYSDGTFRPAAPISRQAMAAFVYRSYNYLKTGHTITADATCETPIPFNDVTKTNPFCGDIEFMKDMGFSNGYKDGGYHPTAQSTRQAVAAFIDRLIHTTPASWTW